MLRLSAGVAWLVFPFPIDKEHSRYAVEFLDRLLAIAIPL